LWKSSKVASKVFIAAKTAGSKALRRLGAVLRFKPHHQITFAAENLLNTNSRAVI
jgi:hypothetical protein